MKGFMGLLLLMSIAFPCLAAPQKILDKDSAQLSLMLAAKSYRSNSGSLEMKKLSEGLTADQKLQLYQQYKTTGAWCLLNPVIGLGSLIQGDPVSALIIGGSIIGGFSMANANSQQVQVVSSDGYGMLSVSNETVPTNGPLYYTGLAIGIAGFAYGLIAPWFFEKSDDTKLQSALDMN